MDKKYKKFNREFAPRVLRGFGLLEVMISATIIIIILGTLVTVARASINNNQYMQMRAEATFLAQEGLERVRQIRDSNWIDGDNTTNWDNFELNAGGATVVNGCYKLGLKTYPSATVLRYFLININNSDCVSTLSNRSSTESITNYPLNAHAIDSASPANTYYRLVNIDRSLDNIMSPSVSPSINGAKVTVLVGFVFKGKSKTVSVSEIMTNWRPSY